MTSVTDLMGSVEAVSPVRQHSGELSQMCAMANAPQLGWATIQRKAFNVRVHQTWNKASMAADFYFVLHCAIQIGLNSPRDKNNNECSSISSLAVCVWFAVWLPGANVIRWRFSMDWCDIYSDSANSVLAFVLIEYLSVTVITESQSLTLLCSSSSCHWVQFGPKKKNDWLMQQTV